MKIYLDFDGTVVEHDYPRIGRHNFGCMEIIKKLQNAGHEIILNTYRADLNDGSLEKAISYLNEDSWMFFNDKETELDKITKILPLKIHPNSWSWETMLETDCMFIDDIAYGIPLKPACMVSNPMVNWNDLDIQFIEHKIY